MNPLSKEDQMNLSKAIMGMLDEWGLEPGQIIEVLGLSPKTRLRHLQRYRQEIPLPDDDEVMIRIEHLIEIADALRTTFPRNAKMGPIWLRRPNRRLANRSPLKTMMEDGLKGLRLVRAELDCAYAWDRSVAKI